LTQVLSARTAGFAEGERKKAALWVEINALGELKLVPEQFFYVNLPNQIQHKATCAGFDG